MGLKGGGCFVLAVVLCASLADASGRELLKSAELSQTTGASSNDRRGSAKASSSVQAEDGSVVGEALALADAFAEAENVSKKKFKTLFEEFFAEFPSGPGGALKPYCDAVAAFLDVELQAVARAYAEASVSVLASVSIEGTGRGCASASGQADAAATSVANALVDAYVGAATDKNEAAARARLGARSQAYVTAWAAADADACIKVDDGEGFAEAFKDVLAQAGAKAIASIWLWLGAEVDCHGVSDSFADAEVEAGLKDDKVNVSATGGATVEGEGDASATADAGADANQVSGGKACGGRQGRCCLSSLKNKTTCGCRKGKCVATRPKASDDWIFEDGGKFFSCKCKQRRG